MSYRIFLRSISVALGLLDFLSQDVNACNTTGIGKVGMQTEHVSEKDHLPQSKPRHMLLNFGNPLETGALMFIIYFIKVK